jgi:hypothetical protein
MVIEHVIVELPNSQIRGANPTLAPYVYTFGPRWGGGDLPALYRYYATLAFLSCEL